MRTVAGVVIAVAVLGAACVQGMSTAFYGDLAKAPALPLLIPPGPGLAMAAALHLEHGPVPIRAAYARALAHRGDLEVAGRIVATLPPGPEAAELRGIIAEDRHDLRSAVDAFIEANDVEHAQALVDAIERGGEGTRATALEDRMIARLGAGNGHTEVLAVALWRRGQLEERAVTREPEHALADERESLAYYVRALALAPNDETYLLAAGQQALTLGDRAQARSFYERALEVVPTSADARAGLARARDGGPSS
jgi:tetratricopeptide (TPR) repeat protein